MRCLSCSTASSPGRASGTRELMADKAQIQRVLAAGAERARPEAAELLARVRRAIGRETFSL